MVVYALYCDSNCDEGNILIGLFSDLIKVNEFTKKEFNIEFGNGVDTVDIPAAVYDERLFYNTVELNKINDGIVRHIREDILPYEDAEFLASIEQARKVGVPEDKILKSIEDIDDFFMGG